MRLIVISIEMLCTFIHDNYGITDMMVITVLLVAYPHIVDVIRALIINSMKHANDYCWHEMYQLYLYLIIIDISIRH